MSQSTTGRELLILRHAEAGWASANSSDFDRPLNQQGLKDAPRMGQWMHDQGLHPELILCSPAHRTKSTMLTVLNKLSLAPISVHWEERIYEAATSTLIDIIKDIPDSSRRVLLVGHNPGLESLVLYLTGNSNSINYGFMKPATLARISIPGQWSDIGKESAQLQEIMQPQGLPKGY